MYSIAIIGCGTIARTAHIPAYLANPNAEIRYFCDVNLAQAEACVKEYGCGRALKNYREALADPLVDAVSVCTPNFMHEQIACEALRAGKDVLCEKPAGRTLAEVERMLKVQRETGRILNIGVVNRFNDAVRAIRAYVKSGKLGEVYHVYLSFRSHRAIPGLGGAFTTKAIAGGGVLIDWGVHFLDIAMYVLGDPRPLTVSGETFCRLGKDMSGYTYRTMWAEGTKNVNGTYDVEDSVTALIRTEGPTITVHGAWAQNIGRDEMFIDFMGDRGGIRLSYGKTFQVFTSEFGALVAYEPETKMRDQFRNEIDAFVEDLESREKLPSHIETVILTARIMQGIYDSAAAHREICLAEHED